MNRKNCSFAVALGAVLLVMVHSSCDTGNNTTIPAAPSGLTATPGDGAITISWNAVSGAGSYNLYWSTSSVLTKNNGTEELYSLTGVKTFKYSAP